MPRQRSFWGSYNAGQQPDVSPQASTPVMSEKRRAGSSQCSVEAAGPFVFDVDGKSPVTRGYCLAGVIL